PGPRVRRAAAGGGDRADRRPRDPDRRAGLPGAVVRAVRLRPVRPGLPGGRHSAPADGPARTRDGLRSSSLLSNWPEGPKGKTFTLLGMIMAAPAGRRGPVAPEEPPRAGPAAV